MHTADARRDWQLLSILSSYLVLYHQHSNSTPEYIL